MEENQPNEAYKIPPPIIISPIPIEIDCSDINPFQVVRIRSKF